MTLSRGGILFDDFNPSTTSRAVSNAEAPADTTPPLRRTRWLASWRLWLILLFVALTLIAAAVCIPTYRRMKALQYLENHDVHVEISKEREWLTECFGEFGTALRSVESIGCAEIDDAVLQRAATLGEVKHLSIGLSSRFFHQAIEYEPLTESGVAALQSLRCLESLAIYGKLEVVDGSDPFTGLFAARPPLILVHIDTPLSDAALMELMQIKSLKSLQLDVDDLTRLRDYAPLPNLMSLTFFYEEPFDANWLRTCPKLTTLQLFGTLCDDDLRQIADLKNLEQLVLGRHPNSELTEAGLALLAALTNLKSIHVPIEIVTPATAEMFSTMPALEEIVFYGILENRQLGHANLRDWRVSK